MRLGHKSAFKDSMCSSCNFLLFGQLCSSNLCLQGDTDFRQPWCSIRFYGRCPVTNLCKCKKNTKKGFQGFSGQRPYFTSCCAFSTTLINREKIHLVSSARSPHLSGSCLVGLLQLLHLWKPLPQARKSVAMMWGFISTWSLYKMNTFARMKCHLVFCILQWRQAMQKHNITHTHK